MPRQAPKYPTLKVSSRDVSVWWDHIENEENCDIEIRLTAFRTGSSITYYVYEVVGILRQQEIGCADTFIIREAPDPKRWHSSEAQVLSLLRRLQEKLHAGREQPAKYTELIPGWGGPR